MMSTPSRVATRDDTAEVHRQLVRAMACHDHEAARRIYFTRVLPNPAFSRHEADRLSYRVGAIDEGDRHVAGRRDL